MTYEYTGYSDDRVDDILDLQSHHWGPDREVNRRYFEWKYRANPFGNEPEIQLAYDGAQPVAMQGCYGAQWSCDDATKTAHGKGDMVVHPDHRRKGLSQHLVDEMLRDQRDRRREGVIATSTTNVAVAGMLRSGWRPLVDIETVRRDRHVLPARWTYLEASLRQLIRRAVGRSQLGSMSDGTPPMQLLDELTGLFTRRVDVDGLVRLHESVPPRGWGHVQDRRWFEWRFANPLADYWFAYAYSGGALRAYVTVASGRGIPDRGVRVVDWHGEDESALGQLLNKVAGALDEIRCELGMTRFCEPFGTVGFFRASRRPLHAPRSRLLWYPLSTNSTAPCLSSTVVDWRDSFSDNF